MESTRVEVSMEKAEIKTKSSLVMAYASSPRQGCGWNNCVEDVDNDVYMNAVKRSMIISSAGVEV